MTTDLTAGLDLFVDTLTDALDVPVTRDPGQVVPPCVFVDTPKVVGRTLAGWAVDVPVIVLVPGPADLTAADALLALVPSVLEAVGADTADPTPFAPNGGDGPTFPGMTIPAQVTIERT